MDTPSMGWKMYASILVLIVGSFNVIDGLVAIIRTNYYEQLSGSTVQLPITNNIKTWGWVSLIIGIVMIMAGIAVLTGAMWARIVAVAVLSANMLFQFAYLAHYPFWSFTMLLIDAFAIYGLVAHGGREEVEGYTDRRVADREIDLTTPAQQPQAQHAAQSSVSANQ